MTDANRYEPACCEFDTYTENARRRAPARLCERHCAQLQELLAYLRPYEGTYIVTEHTNKGAP